MRRHYRSAKTGGRWSIPALTIATLLNAAWKTTLSSSAFTFGAHRVHDLAREVEAAWRRRDTARALRLAEILPKVIEASTQALEDYLRNIDETG